KWPLVVAIPGLGYSRLADADIAKRGYAVVSYDVRGQGDARTMNATSSGLDFYGPGEKYDLAEIVAFARAKWSGVVSATQLGVVGGSQGGIHAWFAAAHSEQTLVVAGRGTIRFPRVKAAVAQDFVPDPLLFTHPNGGTQWGMGYLNFLLAPNPPAVYEPRHLSDLERYFLAQDPTGHRAALLAQPGRDVTRLLKDTQVPTLFVGGYYDELNSGHGYSFMVRQMNDRYMHGILSTIGHGAAHNAVEADLRVAARDLWLDHHLWDVPNLASRVERWSFGVVPASTAAYLDPSTLWAHRGADDPTPTGVLRETHWLTDRGVLTTTEPSSGVPTEIVHAVATTFTPKRFHDDASQRLLPQVLAGIPLSERVFRAAPLAADTELDGDPRVSFAVVPDAERFVVAAVLRAVLPGQSGTFMIAHHGSGVLGATPNQLMRLEFDLSPAHIVLPRGTVLELVLRNHWMVEAPMPTALVAAPYFQSSKVRVEHGRGDLASWLQVPRRPRPGVGLVSPRTTLEVRNPVAFPMTVRGHPSRAGYSAWTFCSMSGHTPGAVVGGVSLPLVQDALMGALIGFSTTQYFPGFVGTLDQNGELGLAVQFHTMGTLPIELIGARLSFATLVIEAFGPFAAVASDPLDLYLR
ncbi:MAG: hypothetical protein KDC87_13485, partial [Planctomycetes bacterium]|nr:hypothetical protein [Planctomycetota bacterium]